MSLEDVSQDGLAKDLKNRRRRRKEARPEEIRHAALEELAECGISGSTLAGIARRAGISRTTIYLYFKSKDEILEALARETVERGIDEAAEVARSFEGPFARMFAAVIERIYTNLVAGDAAIILHALLSEGRSQAALVEFYHREILVKGDSTIRQMLEVGIARGDVPASARALDPRVIVAPAITAAVWGMAFDQVEALDLEQFKRDHIQVVLHGILARPAGSG